MLNMNLNCILCNLLDLNILFHMSVTFYADYAPNFEKVDGAYCFWSVRAWVRAWVGHTFCTYCNF